MSLKEVLNTGKVSSQDILLKFYKEVETETAKSGGI